MDNARTPGVSVFILTRDEEANLPMCLAGLKWCDDVVILDSGSRDRTREIALEWGARVVENPWKGFAAQQNWAVQNIKFKHDWVYYSDADEVMDDDLVQELKEIAADPSRTDAAYRLRYRNFFFGKWIRRASLYPVWNVRFFKPEKIRWVREINPVAEVDGSIGNLKGHFRHYSFNKGLAYWAEKHGKYARDEAVETIRALRAGKLDVAGMFQRRDPIRQRKAFRALSFRVPFRPTLRFLYMYVYRGGFLDGWAGLTYCRLLAYVYEYLIVLQVKEIERREKGLGI